MTQFWVHPSLFIIWMLTWSGHSVLWSIHKRWHTHTHTGTHTHTHTHSHTHTLPTVPLPQYYFPISCQLLGECGPALTFDGDLFALKVVQVAQQHLLPVTPVADEAQVRQGALRWAHLLLHFGQQVALKRGRSERACCYCCYYILLSSITLSQWGNIIRIQRKRQINDFNRQKPRKGKVLQTAS